jgi:hypothetical protein
VIPYAYKTAQQDNLHLLPFQLSCGLQTSNKHSASALRSLFYASHYHNTRRHAEDVTWANCNLNNVTPTCDNKSYYKLSCFMPFLRVLCTKLIRLTHVWKYRTHFVRIQVSVFWVVTPCSVVVGYRRFGEPCCLHLHRRENLKYCTDFMYFLIKAAMSIWEDNINMDLKGVV